MGGSRSFLVLPVVFGLLSATASPQGQAPSEGDLRKLLASTRKLTFSVACHPHEPYGQIGADTAAFRLRVTKGIKREQPPIVSVQVILDLERAIGYGAQATARIEAKEPGVVTRTGVRTDVTYAVYFKSYAISQAERKAPRTAVQRILKDLGDTILRLAK